MSENVAEPQVPAQTPAPEQTQGAETTSVARSKEEEQRMRQDKVMVRVMGSLDVVLGKRQVEDAVEELDRREGPSAPKRARGGKCLQCERLELECALQNK